MSHRAYLASFVLLFTVGQLGCSSNSAPAGAAGTVGTDGTAGTGGAAGAGAGGGSPCGDPGTCGPLEEIGCAGATPLCLAKKVSIPASGGGSFFIDATEVTAAQYQAWLSTNPTAPPHFLCKDRSGFSAGTGTDNYPIASVAWCDAYAYCQAVGKRLCLHEEQVRVCSTGNTTGYPYGATYDPNQCNGPDHGIGEALPVASMDGCQSTGVYAGVYDLSGNVYEWVDSCSQITPVPPKYIGGTRCVIVHGSFDSSYPHPAMLLRCGTSTTTAPTDRSDSIGFRCCSG